MNTQEWGKIDPHHAEIITPYIGSLPIKLGTLAKDLGVSVKLSTLPPGQSGMIVRNDAGDYVIKINRHENRPRQRFTLAHELAHFLLHKDYIDAHNEGIIDNVLYRSGAPEQKEYEANRLAADLLMPTALITEQMDKIGAPMSDEVVEYMAKIFEVSNAAMEIKLTPIAA